MKQLMPYLDDILLGCALIAFVTASYLVSAVLGTYALGAAFLVGWFFVGLWMRSPAAQAFFEKIKRKGR